MKKVSRRRIRIGSTIPRKLQPCLSAAHALFQPRPLTASQSRLPPRIFPHRTAAGRCVLRTGATNRSDLEADVDYVAVLHPVVLAFQAQLPGGLYFGLGL